jgi:ADP-ribose pyrophosphatase
MPIPDADAPEEIQWQGQWITARRRGRWEYVTRARGIKAAVILATDEAHVLLVEQYRVPLGCACLELPAGLIGDEVAGEDPLLAARRELEEETGYSAAVWEDLGEFFSSPGMLGESFRMLRARGLTRTGEGGGVEGENITVHRVPLADVAAFMAERRAAGVAMDAKLLMLLGGELPA